ncbi:hypothetical protein GGI04_002197 [Coemansia thaxteri]|uniref:Uncharacterized protein n=1 Tax=Coemansia thaxteri TaxID=2663907 RepID=A0A9W8EGD1_9FUNG|nr:hypothetical protein H4R26_004854 [Coemansia thaxteri]KAJ2005552.1 hypothetical protein GGI04_002197 [Coemansia thaxteri]KAJ2468320.1 hypothetical protein GGI02_003737 [Coemansia sp. RSA 2322]KAJ2477596.1 hypothetical protein EV174_004570 [Coemansia sp. RSA 2320]
MDRRLSQIRHCLANASNTATSKPTAQLKHANPWPEDELEASSSHKRTAAWSTSEKERVFELLQLGLTSPLMIAKHMGATKSLCQVAEFLEYLQVCSVVLGSDSEDVLSSPEASDPSSASGSQTSSEESDSGSNHRAVAAIADPALLEHRSKPESIESTSESSGYGSEPSSESEPDSDMMSIGSESGYMSVESARSGASPMHDSSGSSIGESSGSSSDSEGDSDSESDSDSDGVSVVSGDDSSIAKEEKLSQEVGVKRDRETTVYNIKMRKLLKGAPREGIGHYNRYVLFDTEFGDILAKLIHGDDRTTVDYATYTEMQQAVVHFVRGIIKDSIIRQAVTRGAIHENSNGVKATSRFQCIFEAIDSSGFPARKPASELYDGLLRKCLDEDVYRQLQHSDEPALAPPDNTVPQPAAASGSANAQ